MPSSPILRACAAPVLCAALAIRTAPLLIAPAAAEPQHAAHAHPPAAKPPVPAPAPPPPPAGPLNTEAVTVPHPEKSLVEAMAHAGPRLVAVGVNGLILLSDDDGRSWRQVQPPVQATLTGVSFVDDSTGWAIGHYGVVLRTEDGGESWSLVLDARQAAQITLEAALSSNASDTARLKAIESAHRLGDADPARAFLLMQADGPDVLRVIGGGMALETEDGGKHWHPWSNAIDNPDATTLLGMAERDGVMVVDGAKGILLAGRPEDGLRTLHSPTDVTLFGALDAGRFGFLLFGQQGNAFTGTLAQPATATKADAWHQVDTPARNSFTAALLRRDGTVLLGDAAGMVWTLSGKPDNPRLDLASQHAPFPILSMVDTADGALEVAGTGGVLRIEPEAKPATGPAGTPASPGANPGSGPAAVGQPAAPAGGTEAADRSAVGASASDGSARAAPGSAMPGAATPGAPTSRVPTAGTATSGAPAAARPGPHASAHAGSPPT